METKKCKECGRELSIGNFAMSRWGHYVEVCKECVKKKKANARYVKKNWKQNSSIHTCVLRPRF